MPPKLQFYFFLLYFIIPRGLGDNQELKPPHQVLKENLNSAKFPPCQLCRILTNSFLKQMERTSRGKFEGGDAAWEEERLQSYSTSEVRLIEIQENLCTDIKDGINQVVNEQCHFLAEENEQLLEEWWFSKQKEEPDLFKFLCINTLRHCCPDNHYGTECKACPGFPDNVCNKSGKCKGAGTRKGNGTCICEPGYTGDFCNFCASNYYESYRDQHKLLCSKCHISCDGACSQGGPKGCSACKQGWFMSTDKVCLDLNECFLEKNVCKGNQFCVNNEGSFSCLECDKSCSKCQGDGPDMCENCAKGYIRQDNMCVDEEEMKRGSHVKMSRYFTYFGLCLATCIILQKSPIAASVIGFIVALYISVSEYMMNTRSISGTAEEVDIGKLLGTS